MKKRTLFAYPMLLLASFLLVINTSCEKEEDKLLSASPLNQELSKDSGSFNITITSNIDWTVSSNSDWCIVNTTNGSGDGIVAVNYSNNMTESKRNATISITASGVNPVEVKVSQENEPIIGAWRHTYHENEYFEFRFNSDLTGRLRDVYYGYTYDDNFTYELTENIVILTWTEDNYSEAIPYEIIGNELTLFMDEGAGMIFLRQ